jgi:hypothetical protein
MSGRLAAAEVCDAGSCQTSHLLVRGDRISFVSVEQAKRVGDHPLDERKMPSDITLPADFVLVHDTSGLLFDRCHMHIVRWRGGRKKLNGAREKDVQVAHTYFGRNVAINVGEVEVPEGPWSRVAKVKYIRYRRQGNAKGNYEHPFDPPVFLYSTQRPLSWKLKLPNGCIVDERGFVRP